MTRCIEGESYKRVDDGSGRTGCNAKSKPLIGEVILHDKLDYWKYGDHYVHYHQGMKAGDSTLNALMALGILTTMDRADPEGTLLDRDVRAAVLEEYVKFMTTPGTHNDTYAESFHRSFFKDWSMQDIWPVTGLEIMEFAEERYQQKTRGSEDHQLAVIGSLVPAIPWILRSANKTEDECAASTVEFIKLTHPVSSLVPYIDLYARLLHRVLNGHDVKTELLKMLDNKAMGGPMKKDTILKLLAKAACYSRDSEQRLKAHQKATAMLGSACYIEGAFSSLSYLALEFSEDFEAGILANANCGGENCHRGAALGALLGAATSSSGQSIADVWKDGLGSARPGLINLLESKRK